MCIELLSGRPSIVLKADIGCILLWSAGAAYIITDMAACVLVSWMHLLKYWQDCQTAETETAPKYTDPNEWAIQEGGPCISLWYIMIRIEGLWG